METQPFSTIGERLEYYITRVLGMTKSDYTVRIGLPAGSTTISNYCNNKYAISPRSIDLMVAFDSEFPTDWITKGEGDLPKKRKYVPDNGSRKEANDPCERYAKSIDSLIETINKQNTIIENLSDLLKKERLG